MIRIRNKIYWWAETNEWVCCGRVHIGADGEYIEWLK